LGASFLLKDNYQTVKHTNSVNQSKGSNENLLIPSQSQSQPKSTNEHIFEIESQLSNDEINIPYFVKQMYELKYLFAQNSFNSPTEISKNVVVQYAFCYLYYESLVDMPVKTGITYRKASEQQIASKIKQLFNITRTDINQADLYNQQKQIFEMWEPKLTTKVFSSSKCIKLKDKSYEITSTFYKNASKSITLDTIVATFEKNESGIYIKKMMTK
jgi:hypothetical protein